MQFARVKSIIQQKNEAKLKNTSKNFVKKVFFSMLLWAHSIIWPISIRRYLHHLLKKKSLLARMYLCERECKCMCVCACVGVVWGCVCGGECVRECVHLCVCVREGVCVSPSLLEGRSVIYLLVSSRPSIEVRVLQIAGEGRTSYIILVVCAAPKSALFRCQKVTVRVLLSWKSM